MDFAPEEWTSPRRNGLRPGEIGSAFHRINIPQGRRGRQDFQDFLLSFITFQKKVMKNNQPAAERS